MWFLYVSPNFIVAQRKLLTLVWLELLEMPQMLVAQVMLQLLVALWDLRFLLVFKR